MPGPPGRGAARARRPRRPALGRRAVVAAAEVPGPRPDGASRAAAGRVPRHRGVRTAARGRRPGPAARPHRPHAGRRRGAGRGTGRDEPSGPGHRRAVAAQRRQPVLRQGADPVAGRPGLVAPARPDPGQRRGDAAAQAGPAVHGMRPAAGAGGRGRPRHRRQPAGTRRRARPGIRGAGPARRGPSGRRHRRHRTAGLHPRPVPRGHPRRAEQHGQGRDQPVRRPGAAGAAGGCRPGRGASAGRGPAGPAGRAGVLAAGGAGGHRAPRARGRLRALPAGAGHRLRTRRRQRGAGRASCSSSPRHTSAPGSPTRPRGASVRRRTPAGRPGTRSGWRGRRWASRPSGTGRGRRTPNYSTCSARPRGGWKRRAARWPCSPGSSRHRPAHSGTDRTRYPVPRSARPRTGPCGWRPPRTTRAPWPPPGWRCTTRCGSRGPRPAGCPSSPGCSMPRGRAATTISWPRRTCCAPRRCWNSATRKAGTRCSATSPWPATWVTPGGAGPR